MRPLSNRLWAGRAQEAHAQETEHLARAPQAFFPELARARAVLLRGSASQTTLFKLNTTAAHQSMLMALAPGPSQRKIAFACVVSGVLSSATLAFHASAAFAAPA